MRFRYTLFVTLAPMAILACGGDDPTEVNVVPIGGMWSFEAEMSRPGQSCNQTTTTLDIQHDGSTFSGTITGGVWSCTDGLVTIDIDLNESTLTVQNGRIDGPAISFEIRGKGGGNASLTGTAGVAMMSGTGSWRGQTATLNGTWTATRR
ncbi:MAG: hypothetical protein BMS9Abin29_2234 [Gemmatimonadota bacterium]|nr:MAG: hypothetical protein BMS9Abin29_2234 [Gemmatimonadota bacterium]